MHAVVFRRNLTLLLAVSCLKWHYPAVAVIFRNPDMDRNATELISIHGYPALEYNVVTSDGYVLGMQRIPCGVKDRYCDVKKRPAILLQHGILESSEVWVLNGPQRSFGFILADAGYDVWLGNSRGNRLARKHLYLDTEDFQYWNYTYEEMGREDLSAMVDFVLDRTRQLSIFYVGFSMGSTMAYVLLSEKPHYNKKFRLMVMLSPVTSTNAMRSPVTLLAPIFVSQKFLFDPTAHGEFLRRGPLPPEICSVPLLRHVCYHNYWLFNGYNLFNVDKNRMDVYFAHFPAGVSRKTVAHYAQSYYSDIFRKYDYGVKGNLQHYGQVAPPEYNLSRVLAPTVVFWAENDWANGPRTIMQASAKLPNLVALLKVPDPFWGHMDFDNGVHANRVVYQKVIAILRKF